MAVVITGDGLGLYNSSLNNLGNRSDAAIGRQGDEVYVNAATGNLVVRQRDEFLKSTGPDLSLLRTYNSQGVLDGDNNDNWRLNVYQKLEFSGAANTAGSTITKTYGDGSQSVFTFDAVLGYYVSSNGEGAHDTIKQQGADWVWNAGDGAVNEIYNAAGQPSEVQDKDGNIRAYVYTGSLITQINDSSGQTVNLVYSGNNLQHIETISAGITNTRTSYSYDASNRLETVTVDLSPEDSSTVDGNIFTTTYTYDGISNRVASINNSDGSSLAVSYNADGKVQSITNGEDGANTYAYHAGYTSVTNALGNESLYFYDAENRLTEVQTPPLAATGQRISTQYVYDAQGNLHKFNDGHGNATEYSYDGRGNLLSQRDAVGNVVEYGYTNSGQLQTKIVYLRPDPDGAGADLPGEPQTTHYVYDDEDHLRFMVSPEGAVTEHRYNIDGSRSETLQYAGDVYPGTTLKINPSALLSYSTDQDFPANGSVEVLNSGNTLRLSGNRWQRLPFAYTATADTVLEFDFASNQLGEIHAIGFASGATVPGAQLFKLYGHQEISWNNDFNSYSGNGAAQHYRIPLGEYYTGAINNLFFIMDDDAVVGAESLFSNIRVYEDAAHSVLTEAELSGWANDPARNLGLLERTDYQYDFRGQLSSSTTYSGTNADGSGTIVAGTTLNINPSDLQSYSAGQDFPANGTVEVLDSGNTLRLSGNRWQRLPFSYAATSNTVLEFDFSSNQLGEIHAIGFASSTWVPGTQLFKLYGHQTIDWVNNYNNYTGNGAAQHYRIPLGDYYTGTINNLFFVMDDDAVVGAESVFSNIRLHESSAATTHYIYDQYGRLLKRVDPRGSAPGSAGWQANSYETAYLYDGLGRVVSQTDALGNTTSTTYNDAGQSISTTLANGLIQTTVFDSNGRAISVSELDPADLSTPLSGSNHVYDAAGQLRAVQEANGVIAYTFYDAAGRVSAVIDGTGSLVENIYDNNGNPVQRIEYATKVSSSLLTQLPVFTGARLTGANETLTLVQLRPASHADDRTIYNYYDEAGQLLFEIDGEGYVTEYRYDGAGQLTDTIAHSAAFPGFKHSPESGAQISISERVALLRWIDTNIPVGGKASVLLASEDYAYIGINAVQVEIDQASNSGTISLLSRPEQLYDTDALAQTNNRSIQPKTVLASNTHTSVDLTPENPFVGINQALIDTYGSPSFSSKRILNDSSNVTRIAGGFTVPTGSFVSPTGPSTFTSVGLYESAGGAIVAGGQFAGNSSSGTATFTNDVSGNPIADGSYVVTLKYSYLEYGPMGGPVTKYGSLNYSVTLNGTDQLIIPRMGADSLSLGYRPDGSSAEYTSVAAGNIAVSGGNFIVTLPDHLVGNYEYSASYISATDRVAASLGDFPIHVSAGTSSHTSGYYSKAAANGHRLAGVLSSGAAANSIGIWGDIATDKIFSVKAEVIPDELTTQVLQAQGLLASVTQPVITNTAVLNAIDPTQAYDVNISTLAAGLPDGNYDIKLTTYNGLNATGSVLQQNWLIEDYRVGLVNQQTMQIPMPAALKPGDSAVFYYRKIEGAGPRDLVGNPFRVLSLVGDPGTAREYLAISGSNYEVSLFSLENDTQYEFMIEVRDAAHRLTYWSGFEDLQSLHSILSTGEGAITNSFNSNISDTRDITYKFYSDSVATDAVSGAVITGGTRIPGYLPAGEIANVEHMKVNVFQLNADGTESSVQTDIYTVPHIIAHYNGELNISRGVPLEGGRYRIDVEIVYKDRFDSGVDESGVVTASFIHEVGYQVEQTINFTLDASGNYSYVGDLGIASGLNLSTAENQLSAEFTQLSSGLYEYRQDLTDVSGVVLNEDRGYLSSYAGTAPDVKALRDYFDRQRQTTVNVTQQNIDVYREPVGVDGYQLVLGGTRSGIVYQPRTTESFMVTAQNLLRPDVGFDRSDNYRINIPSIDVHSSTILLAPVFYNAETGEEVLRRSLSGFTYTTSIAGPHLADGELGSEPKPSDLNRVYQNIPEVNQLPAGKYYVRFRSLVYDRVESRYSTTYGSPIINTHYYVPGDISPTQYQFEVRGLPGESVISWPAYTQPDHTIALFKYKLPHETQYTEKVITNLSNPAVTLAEGILGDVDFQIEYYDNPELEGMPVSRATGQFNLAIGQTDTPIITPYRAETVVRDTNGSSLVSTALAQTTETFTTIEAVIQDLNTGELLNGGTPVITDVAAITGYTGQVNLSTDLPLISGRYQVTLTVKNGTTIVPSILGANNVFVLEIGPQQEPISATEIRWSDTGRAPNSDVYLHYKLKTDNEFAAENMWIRATPHQDVQGEYYVQFPQITPDGKTLNQLPEGEYDYIIVYAEKGTRKEIESTAGRFKVQHIAADAEPVTDIQIKEFDRARDSRVARVLYDGDGRQVGSLDGEGYLTELIYDSAGRVVESIRYNNRALADHWREGALEELRPLMLDPLNDIHEYFVYNGRGQLLAEINGEAYVTEYRYDVAGNQAAVIEYAHALNASVFAGLAGNAKGLSLASVLPLADSVNDRIIGYEYNANNQVVAETNAEGSATRYSYDNMGRLISVRSGEASVGGDHELRTLQNRYDLQGNLLATFSAEGHKTLQDWISANPSATPAQIDAQTQLIWQQYATHSGYDAAGQKISDTVYSSDHGNLVTRYYYDGNGRIRYSINALGEIQERIYNSFGNVSHTLQYANRLGATALAGLAGGLLTDSVRDTLSGLRDPINDSVVEQQYDNRGLAVARIDELGNRQQLHYNAFGDIQYQSEVISGGALDGTEVEVEHRYDRRGLLTNTLSNTLSGTQINRGYDYDAFGRELAGYTYDNIIAGQTRQHYVNRYDRLGNLLERFESDSTIDPQNPVATLVERYQYDAFGRVVNQTDALGNTTTYSYNKADRSVNITTPEGVSTTTRRNRQGEQISITDSSGARTEYQYNKNGDLTATTLFDADGTQLSEITNEYDSAGRLVLTTDAEGGRVSTAYEQAGRVLSRTVDPAGLALTTTYAYDAKGQVIKSVDPEGVITETYYDNKGQITHVIMDAIPDSEIGSGREGDYLALTTYYSYDSRGKRLSVSVGNQPGMVTDSVTGENFYQKAINHTEYTYDKHGRLVREVIDPDVTLSDSSVISGLNLVTNYEYDTAGNLIAETNANGHATHYIYDKFDRLVYSINANGNVLENRYDANGNAVRSVEYLNGLSGVDIQGFGHSTTVADVSTLIAANTQDRHSQTIYDQDGRITHTINATGVVSERHYDAAGQVAAIKQYSEQLTDVATVSYSSAAQVTTALAAVRAATSDTVPEQYSWSVYDAAGRALYNVDSLGYVTANTYDGNGNIVKTIEHATALPGALLNSDALTRSQIETNLTAHAQDRATRYVYDAVGRQTFKIDALGYVIQTAYDKNNNVTQTTHYENALTGYSDLPTQLEMLAAVTTLASSQDHISKTQYDGAGRASGSITVGENQHGELAEFIESYSYDGAGNRLSLTNAKGDTWYYRYDAANRLIEERSPEVEVTRLQSTLWQQGFDTDMQGITLHSGADTLNSAIINDQRLELHTRDAAAQSWPFLLGERSYDFNEGVIFQSELNVGENTARYVFSGFTAVDYGADSVSAHDDRYRRYGALVMGNTLYIYDDNNGAITFNALFDVTANTDYIVEVETGQGGATLFVYKPGQNRAEAYQHQISDTTLDIAHSMLFTQAGPGLGGSMVYVDSMKEIVPYGSRYAEDGATLSDQTAVQSVVTQFEYNGLGDVTARVEAAGTLDQRTTRYQYDALGNQIITRLPETSVYSYNADAGNPVDPNNPADNALRTGRAAEILLDDLQSLVYHDAFGNAAAYLDVNGNLSFKVYDRQNQLRYEIDALGFVTEYRYDAFGNNTSLIRYANSIAANLPPVPTTDVEVQALFLTEAQVNGWVSAVADTAQDRTLTTEYDALNRATSVIQNSVLTGAVNETSGVVTVSSQAPTTINHYNAFGELVKQSTATVGDTLDAYFYYDKMGRKVGSLDAAGFVSVWEYDGEGNVTRQVEYAKPIALPANPLDFASVQAAVESSSLAYQDPVQSHIYSTDAGIDSTSTTNENTDLTVTSVFDPHITPQSSSIRNYAWQLSTDGSALQQTTGVSVDGAALFNDNTPTEIKATIYRSDGSYYNTVYTSAGQTRVAGDAEVTTITAAPNQPYTYSVTATSDASTPTSQNIEVSVNSVQQYTTLPQSSNVVNYAWAYNSSNRTIYTRSGISLVAGSAARNDNSVTRVVANIYRVNSGGSTTFVRTETLRPGHTHTVPHHYPGGPTSYYWNAASNWNGHVNLTTGSLSAGTYRIDITTYDEARGDSPYYMGVGYDGDAVWTRSNSITVNIGTQTVPDHIDTGVAWPQSTQPAGSNVEFLYRVSGSGGAWSAKTVSSSGSNYRVDFDHMANGSYEYQILYKDSFGNVVKSASDVFTVSGAGTGNHVTGFNYNSITSSAATGSSISAYVPPAEYAIIDRVEAKVFLSGTSTQVGATALTYPEAHASYTGQVNLSVGSVLADGKYDVQITKHFKNGNPPATQTVYYEVGLQPEVQTQRYFWEGVNNWNGQVNLFMGAGGMPLDTYRVDIAVRDDASAYSYIAGVRMGTAGAPGADGDGLWTRTNTVYVTPSTIDLPDTRYTTLSWGRSIQPTAAASVEFIYRVAGSGGAYTNIPVADNGTQQSVNINLLADGNYEYRIIYRDALGYEIKTSDGSFSVNTPNPSASSTTTNVQSAAFQSAAYTTQAVVGSTIRAYIDTAAADFGHIDYVEAVVFVTGTSEQVGTATRTYPKAHAAYDGRVYLSADGVLPDGQYDIRITKHYRDSRTPVVDTLYYEIGQQLRTGALDNSEYGIDRETQYGYDQLNRLTSETQVGVQVSTASVPTSNGSPDTGSFSSNVENLTSHRRYDALGNLVREENSAGNVRYREYDALGRVLSVTDFSRTQELQGPGRIDAAITVKDEGSAGAYLIWDKPLLPGFDLSQVNLELSSDNWATQHTLTLSEQRYTLTAALNGIPSGQYQYRLQYTRMGETVPIGKLEGTLNIMTATAASSGNAAYQILDGGTRIRFSGAVTSVQIEGVVTAYTPDANNEINLGALARGNYKLTAFNGTTELLSGQVQKLTGGLGGGFAIQSTDVGMQVEILSRQEYRHSKHRGWQWRDANHLRIELNNLEQYSKPGIYADIKLEFANTKGETVERWVSAHATITTVNGKRQAVIDIHQTISDTSQENADFHQRLQAVKEVKIWNGTLSVTDPLAGLSEPFLTAALRARFSGGGKLGVDISSSDQILMLHSDGTVYNQQLELINLPASTESAKLAYRLKDSDADFNYINLIRGGDGYFFVGSQGIPAGQYEYQVLLNGANTALSEHTGTAVFGRGVSGQASVSVPDQLAREIESYLLTPHADYKVDIFGNTVAHTQYAGNASVIAAADGSVDITAPLADGSRDQTTYIQYNNFGYKSQQVDGEGNSSYFAYDRAGNLTKQWNWVSDPADPDNLLARRMAGSVNRYDALGRQIERIELADELGTIDLVSNTVALNDKLVTHQTEYNAFGEVTGRGIKQRGGIQEYFHYDQTGRIWRSNQDDGIDKLYIYDTQGNLVQQLRSPNKSATNLQTLAYNSTALQNTVNLGLSSIEKSTYHYNKLGQTTKVRQPGWLQGVHTMMPVVEQRSDRWGNITRLIDPAGTHTTYRYNHQNLLVEEIKAAANASGTGGGVAITGIGSDGKLFTDAAATPTSRFFYDEFGNALGQVDANGHARINRYNEAGEVIENIAADGGSTWHRYDNFGREIETVRQKDADTNYSTLKLYDKNNRLISEYGSGDIERHYAYDELGNRTQLRELSWKDSVGNKTYHTTNYLFDVRGNLIKEDPQGDKFIIYGYDLQNNKDYEFNGLRYVNGVGLTVLRDQSWNYDYFGLLTGYNDLGDVNYSYGYDDLNRLSTQSNGRGQNVSYSYYENGLRKQYRDDSISSGLIENYEYDIAGRQTRVEQSRAYDAYTTYSYDKLGRVTNVHAESSDSQLHWGMTHGNRGYYVDMNYEYDAMGNRRHVHGAEGRTNGFTYNTGPASDPNTVTITEPEVIGVTPVDLWYTYDEENRVLISQGQRQANDTISRGSDGIQMQYDFLGYRSQTVRKQNSSTVTDRHEYDTAGRLLRTTQNGFDASRRSYDLRGRLMMQLTYATDAGGSVVSSSPKELRQYTYDSNGDMQELIIHDYSGGLTTAEAQQLDAIMNDPLGGLSIPAADSTNRLTYSYDEAGNTLSYLMNTSGESVTYYIDYTYSYQYLDSVKTSTITANGYSHDGTTTTPLRQTYTSHTYDANGHLIQVRDELYHDGETTPSNEYRDFLNDAQGRVVRKHNTRSGPTGSGSQQPGMQFYYYTQQAGIGTGGKLDGVDFDFNYTPLNSENLAPTPGGYIVRQGDTLQSIALAVYGDAQLWYLIADANGVTGSDELQVNQTLKIPNASSARNSSENFKPYNPGQIIGDTTPAFPTATPVPVDNGGSNAFAMILMVVVAVVVTAVTGGAGAGFMANFISGMLGSLASQVVGNMMGVLDGYDFKSALVSGLTAGITQGLGAGKAFAKSLKISSDVASHAVAQVTNNIIGQGISIAAGVQEEFSWQSVAVTAISAPITFKIDQAINGTAVTAADGTTSRIGGAAWAKDNPFAADLVTGLANGAVNNAAQIVVNRGGKMEWANIATNAFGQALGNRIAEQINTPRAAEPDAVQDQEDRAQQAAGLEAQARNAAAGAKMAGDASRDNVSKADDKNLEVSGGNSTVGKSERKVILQEAGVSGTVSDFIYDPYSTEEEFLRRYSDMSLFDNPSGDEFDLGIELDFLDIDLSLEPENTGVAWLADKAKSLLRAGKEFFKDRREEAFNSGVWVRGESSDSIWGNLAKHTAATFSGIGGSIFGGAESILGVAEYGVEAGALYHGNLLNMLSGGRFNGGFADLNGRTNAFVDMHIGMAGMAADFISNEGGMRTRAGIAMWEFGDNLLAGNAGAWQSVSEFSGGMLLGGMWSKAGGLGALRGPSSLSGRNINISSLADEFATANVSIPGKQVVSVGGVKGVRLDRRLGVEDMRQLQKDYGTEFAQIYVAGKGKNGRGGMTVLIQGSAGGVPIPLGKNIRWINHTHPQILNGQIVPLRASAEDMFDVLKALQKKGSPQKTSQIVPEVGDAFHFDTKLNRK